MSVILAELAFVTKLGGRICCFFFLFYVVLHLFVLLLFPAKTKDDHWSSSTERAHHSLNDGCLHYRNGKFWSPKATQSSLQW